MTTSLNEPNMAGGRPCDTGNGQRTTDNGPERLFDCIVISDLHLGSDVCQAKLLEEFLIWAVDGWFPQATGFPVEYYALGGQGTGIPLRVTMSAFVSRCHRSDASRP